ncbi:MAG: hypothetical protein KDC05_05870 [Bacteroidales bacterium]|nr:hypothetical protein [Bacteroidales bacterium]
MNRFIHFLFIFLISLNLSATAWQGITSNQPEAAAIELTSSNIHQSVITFSLEGFQFIPVETPNGNAGIIDIENSSRILVKGAPDLAKLTASVIIPDMAQMKVEVIDAKFETFEEIEIAPSKGNFSRDNDPANVPFEYGRWYSEDKFYPGELAELRNPYIVRDHRGQTVIVYPFQYNPVTKTLKVYTSLTVKLSETGNAGYNPLVRQSIPDKIDADFSKIYAHHFLNSSITDYTPVEEEGNMLVISYGAFMADMQAFVDWKNTIGIPTEMVNVSTIGNSAAIKTYIANYYNTNGLTYVLLVGDASQVPSSYASGDSDNDYSYIVGSDHYPDIFVGRFSAETAAHVQTQVQRTIEYEQTPNTGYDFYTKCMGIASDQGPGDDSEYDYQHIRNMQTDLLNYTYDYNFELFDGSQGGNDASGNPSSSMVGADINSGTGIILYTGHGSTTSWSSSGFSSTSVNSLTNTGKLPFIWSVACVNGNFVGTTCFAEAWMRATYNNEPSGAIATLMSTINQSWNPPMEGQDEMVDLLVESYANNIKRSFGGLSMNGCMKMNDTYGSAGDEMTDTWTCFGDPSVMVRTAVPQILSVSHNPVIMLGSDQFSVTCAEEGALVCISIDHQIIGKALVSGGMATVNFDPLTTVETATIAVTAYNHVPYLADVDIVPASGPYISISEIIVNDVNGNNNGEPDYGEIVTLHVTLENAGSADANNVDAILSSTSPFVTIMDNAQNWGTIGTGSVSQQTDAFAITFHNDIPDQTSVPFTLEVSGTADEIWTSNFNLTALAPVIEAGTITITDNQPGNNNNGILDPGETVTFSIGIDNTGASVSPVFAATLTTGASGITIQNETFNGSAIASGGNAIATFTVEADAGISVGSTADFNFNATAGAYSGNQVYNVVIGQIPVVIIDLDDTPISGTAMQTCLNSLGIAHDYVTSIPSDLDLYSTAFVLLGIYSNNHVLSTTEGQTLANFLSGGGNLYMEGGDTWAYDASTTVHGMFGIDGSADGSSDMGTALGQSGTFTDGMTFTYAGENNYIDHLDPISPAFAVFRNQSPDYGCVVAHDAGSYKTIGASCEFGGFTDAASPSTKLELMTKYLGFFGMGGSSDPVISLNPISLDYGNVLVNSTQILSFTIQNTGGGNLTGDITTPPVFAVAAGAKNNLKVNQGKNSLNFSIGAYGSQEFELAFAPVAALCYNGNVTINSNDPVNPVISLPVSGCGIEAPEIAVNPASFNVLLAPGGSTNLPLEIFNNGGSQLNIDASVVYDPGTKDADLFYPQNTNYWTGSCTSTAKTETSQVTCWNTEDGWMKFDISSIPQGATINSIVFHGYVSETYYPYWSVTSLPMDPVTATASDIKTWVEANSSSTLAYYYGNEASTFATGWHAWSLTASAITDMEAALSSGWFAMGLDSRDNSSTYYIVFDGWMESTLPFLDIEYTWEPTYNWLSLDGGINIAQPVDAGSSYIADIGFDATGLTEGVYEAEIVINNNDPVHNPLTIPVTLTVGSTPTLEIKVNLEGPFNGIDMNTTLSDKDLIPSNQPYGGSPWYYEGTETAAGLNGSGSVDWVLVEMRDAPGGPETATSSTILSTKAAILLDDGSIVGTDLSSALLVDMPVSGNLFIVIRHRNHVPVMSANALILSANTYTYDFTSGADAVYGGISGHKEISPGVWGMMAGDGQCNGQVDMNDKVIYWNNQVGEQGYLPSDLNLDGETNNIDKIEYWVPNYGAGSMVLD